MPKAGLGGHRRSIGDGRVFRFGLNTASDDAHVFAAVLLYFDNFPYGVHSVAPPPTGHPDEA